MGSHRHHLGLRCKLANYPLRSGYYKGLRVYKGGAPSVVLLDFTLTMRLIIQPFSGVLVPIFAAHLALAASGHRHAQTQSAYALA